MSKPSKDERIKAAFDRIAAITEASYGIVLEPELPAGVICSVCRGPYHADPTETCPTSRGC